MVVKISYHRLIGKTFHNCCYYSSKSSCDNCIICIICVSCIISIICITFDFCIICDICIHPKGKGGCRAEAVCEQLTRRQEEIVEREIAEGEPFNTTDRKISKVVVLIVADKCWYFHFCCNHNKMQAISDAEKQAKLLKEEQRSVREAVNDNAKQTKM